MISTALLVLGSSIAAADRPVGGSDIRELHCTPIAGYFRGTEGLITGPAGEYYASEESGRGIIWRCHLGRATLFCNLTESLDPTAGTLLGLARIGENLFVASPSYGGGSVIRIPLSDPEHPCVFVTHLGPIPNGLISDGHVLFVSETILSHLYRLSLDRAPGTAARASERFPSPRSAPNGLALSPDRRTLSVIHTGMIFTGYVSAIDAATMKLRDAVPFSGMGDGVAWWHGALWGCRQREGQLVRLDPAHLDHQTTYQLTGGRESGGIRPASIAFADGTGTAAVTDVAKANAFNYLLRFFHVPLPWHHDVYQFSTRSL